MNLSESYQIGHFRALDGIFVGIYFLRREAQQLLILFLP